MCIASLNDLLEKPFKCYAKEEQLKIAKRGRFTDLVNLSQNDKGKCRTFAVSWYQRVKWLTGNTVNRKLYCWSCVLFPSGSSKMWNTTGFDDLRNLSQTTKKHEESKEHTYSTIKLRLLCKSDKTGDNAKEELEKNVMVKRNREYLARLIDISTALARLGLPFRSEDDGEGTYKSWLNLLKKYDDIVRTQIEHPSAFKGLTKTIQVDLVQSIAQVVRLRIVEEAAAANFFSLIVDDVHCNPIYKQISIVIRYIRNGIPIERFIGLYCVGYATKSDEVMSVLEKELEVFNFKEKMISQSYGGAVVRATELYSLQQVVKRKQNMYCQAQFVHYYAHDFSSLLAQSLCCVQECKLFFSIISLFISFSKKTRMHLSVPGMPSSIPKCINFIKQNYNSILGCLEFVTTTAKFELSMAVISNAVNLINHLKSFKFMALLTLFDEVFSIIEESMQFFSDPDVHARIYRKQINEMISKLKRCKTDTEFNAIINNVVTEFNGAASTIINMFALHMQIIDNLIHEIEGRCLDIELADFFELVSLDSIPQSPGIKKSPENALLASIKENYATIFDVAKLRNELDLFYSDSAIGGIGEHEINKTSDILKFIHDNDIKMHLPELYKLLEFVVTIPTVHEPLTGQRCASNRIREYCAMDRKEEPAGALALLWIENDLLAELESANTWYSQVISHFAKLPSTSSIELIYKNVEKAPEVPKIETIIEPELSIKTEPDIS